MRTEWNFDLKQRFSLKCFADTAVFLLTCIFVLAYTKMKGIASYDALVMVLAIFIVNAVSYMLTKQWLVSAIKKIIDMQSTSISDVTDEIMENSAEQKRAFESLVSNARSVSGLVNKLKDISENFVTTTKNTEKQISQSINFSQKEINHNMIKILIM